MKFPSPCPIFFVAAWGSPAGIPIESSNLETGCENFPVRVAIYVMGGVRSIIR